MGAGLWLDETSYVDTTDATHRTTFTIRIKAKSDTQAVGNGPNIVTSKGYFASAFSDFPWDLGYNLGQFNALHDRGNDFSADTILSSRAEYRQDKWYDIVTAHIGTGVRLWVAPYGQPAQGQWIEATSTGNVANSGRNIFIGRAPAELGGGVGNSGWIGEVAHYEYWAQDMLSVNGWLHNWRPPMRDGGSVPANLIRYIPFDDGSGTTVRELVGATTKTITGTAEWRRTLYRDEGRRDWRRAA
jgi:hypothetical protein